MSDMKVTVERKDFAAAIAACAKVTPAQTTLPVLSRVELRAEDDTLLVSATDLDHFLRVHVPADVSKPGECLAPAKLLAELCKKLIGGSVEIHSKKNGIAFSAGETRARFSKTEDDFPNPPGRPVGESMQVSAGVLRALVSATSFAISTDENRPILNGIFWQIRSGSLTMVATNGHRLARRIVQTKIETQHADLIVPPKPLETALKLLGDASDVSVSFTDSHLWLTSDRVEVAVRLIEGSYPNYDAIIPRAHKRTAMISTGHLAAVVERVAVFAPTTTDRVLLRFNNELRIEADNVDLGHAEESVPIQYEGAPLTVGVSAVYLREVLKHVDTDTLRIDMTESERALMFRPHADDSFLALLMPLRLLDDENREEPPAMEPAQNGGKKQSKRKKDSPEIEDRRMRAALLEIAPSVTTDRGLSDDELTEAIARRWDGIEYIDNDAASKKDRRWPHVHKHTYNDADGAGVVWCAAQAKDLGRGTAEDTLLKFWYGIAADLFDPNSVVPTLRKPEILALYRELLELPAIPVENQLHNEPELQPAGVSA